MIEILYIFIFSLLGFLIGLIISLVPGMHINTTSLLLLSIQTTFWSLSEYLGIEPILVPLMISSTIVSAYIASTFSNIIPATFLGAPEEDVALTLLPAHSLLLKGRGYEAIVLSAIGSFGSAVLTLSLLVPIKFLLADPLNLYQNLKSLMPWILIAVIAIMVLTEKTKKAMVISVAVLILSGVYGMVVLKLPLNPLIDFPSTPLFPALAGLFGFSTLISSFISRTEIKSQTIIEPELTESEKKSSIISTITGTLSGIFVSIVPGITTAIGTIIALVFRGRTDEKQTIITLSSVNTSAAIATIANLFIIQKARSGVAVIVNNLIRPDRWSNILPPYSLVYLLIPIVISTSLSFPLTCYLGKTIAKRIGRISYQGIIKISIIFILLLVLVFSGTIGIVILLVGASIGLLPIFLGARRSSCMGILLIPLLLHFLGIS